MTLREAIAKVLADMPNYKAISLDELRVAAEKLMEVAA